MSNAQQDGAESASKTDRISGSEDEQGEHRVSAVDVSKDLEEKASTDQSMERSPNMPSPSTKAEDAAQDATLIPAPAPNGGYGWVCVACCALINAHTWGLNSSYGVFLAHYLATNTFPGASYLEYAFVGSLSISCALLVSPMATITTRRYGTRTTLLVGVVFEFVSLIGASFASRIWHLFLSQGVCFGIGMGFLFVGSVSVPPQWFTTRRSLANGIAAAGSGLGGLVYSLATGAMIQSIGLAWAFRVLGILALVVNSICAILIRDRNKAIGSSQLAFDMTLFRRPEYLLLLGFGWFSVLGYVVLLFSLANYCSSVGLTSTQGATVSAVLNLGQALGRPPIGYFSDAVGRINMACAASFVAGLLSLVLWTSAKSFGLLIFYAIIGGTVAGTLWTTAAPVAAEVVGLRDVPSALNMLWLVLVLPSTFSEPIALEIVAFDGGDYLGAQLFTGAMYMTAAACAFLLRGWKIGELRAVAEQKSGDGDVDAVGVENVAPNTILEEAKKKGLRRMMVDMWKWKKV